MSSTHPGRFFIMRHGETVFNAARRLQGEEAHTPLTSAGVGQALEMGARLRAALGQAPQVMLHASDTGRALQTLALVTGELGLDWFAAKRDARLREIGMGAWGGRLYDEVQGEVGPIVDTDHLLTPALDGEDYPAIAARLTSWLNGVSQIPGDHLVVMHGISSRVLRGVMSGLAPHPRYGAPIAPGLAQGSITLMENGVDSLLYGPEIGAMHA
jgi:probable phosphoglycerate mutase